jgi:hypothetical protein
MSYSQFLKDDADQRLRRCSILIPAAGESKRFSDVGILKPKGLIRSKWKVDEFTTREGTMIEHVVPLRWQGEIRVACKLDLKSMFEAELPKEWSIFPVISTRGQADTVWQACQDLPNDILIINSDNGFSCDLHDFVTYCQSINTVCGTVVFKSRNERYGYINDFPYFEYGVEKIVVSDYALAGAFYFRSAKTIMNAATLALNEPMLKGHEIYLSDLFAHISGLKVGYLIEESKLFEWGSPSQLLKDKSLEVQLPMLNVATQTGRLSGEDQHTSNFPKSIKDSG